MCKKKSRRTSTLVVGGAKVAIHVGGAAIAASNPVCMVSQALVVPILTAMIDELHERHLSEIENERINTFVAEVRSKVSNQENASSMTWDEVLSNSDTINIGRILEAICVQLRSEPDERKLCCYPLFYINIAQDKNLKYSYAVTLIRLFDKLSYRQLQIMRYIKEQQMVDMGQWNPMFVIHTEELANYFDFYSECTNLANMRLLTQSTKHGGYNVSGLGEEILSPLGLQMLTYIEGADLSQGKDEVSNTIEYLNRMAQERKGQP